MPPRRDLAERFWEKVELIPFHSCWEWTGAADAKGYGRIGCLDKVYLAHRISYELHRGPIPSGLDLDHLCRNPRCVNPAHLEPVTRGENVRRGQAGGHNRGKRKPYCSRGHDMTDTTNVSILKDSGWRRCLICSRLKKAEWTAKYGRKKI